ncbi:hypothetical protein WKI68_32150 [Streptomyces sp. MS1.HAVA.3]|uniref:Uncharacterized protein n=1 Tax=Streptomyces caledonius TaxID=3134107 RepID=A0ABU8U9W8_9ACTN
MSRQASHAPSYARASASGSPPKAKASFVGSSAGSSPRRTARASVGAAWAGVLSLPRYAAQSAKPSESHSGVVAVVAARVATWVAS